MHYPYKKLFFLVLIPLMTPLLSQECDRGFVWIEEVPISCGETQHCFFVTDLNILQEMIDNSSETINMLLDSNEDGVMQALELGLMEWVDGRLVSLDCFLGDIMNCNLSGPLPQNIGDLTYLNDLWLNGNNLSGEIPESMGNLGSLELLYLSDNQFSGSIPESLCSLNIDWGGVNNWGVEYYNIWGNEICPPYPTCMNAEIVGDQSCSDFLGDINGDGSLNILDIVIITNIILGSAENVPQADVNQDGELNILDIVALANMILN